MSAARVTKLRKQIEAIIGKVKSTRKGERDQAARALKEVVDAGPTRSNNDIWTRAKAALRNHKRAMRAAPSPSPKEPKLNLGGTGTWNNLPRDLQMKIRTMARREERIDAPLNEIITGIVTGNQVNFDRILNRIENERLVFREKHVRKLARFIQEEIDDNETEHVPVAAGILSRIASPALIKKYLVPLMHIPEVIIGLDIYGGDESKYYKYLWPYMSAINTNPYVVNAAAVNLFETNAKDCKKSMGNVAGRVFRFPSGHCLTRNQMREKLKTGNVKRMKDPGSNQNVNIPGSLSAWASNQPLIPDMDHSFRVTCKNAKIYSANGEELDASEYTGRPFKTPIQLPSGHCVTKNAMRELLTRNPVRGPFTNRIIYPSADFLQNLNR
jgi:hypothetical protein